MKRSLILIIVFYTINSTHSQTVTHSETKKTYVQKKEEKKEILKNNTRYLLTTLSVELEGVDSDFPEYALNTPSGNELEVRIEDPTNTIRFSIIKSEHTKNPTVKEKFYTNYTTTYKESIKIRINLPSEIKKQKFTLEILEKIDP